MGVLFITPDITIAKTVLQNMFTFASMAGEDNWSMVNAGKVLFVLLMVIYLRIEISTQVLLDGGQDHRERKFLGWRPPLWAPHLGCVVGSSHAYADIDPYVLAQQFMGQDVGVCAYRRGTQIFLCTSFGF